MVRLTKVRLPIYATGPLDYHHMVVEGATYQILSDTVSDALVCTTHHLDIKRACPPSEPLSPKWRNELKQLPLLPVWSALLSLCLLFYFVSESNFSLPWVFTIGPDY